MRKRKQKQCKMGELLEMKSDRISPLPDELLIHILSRMPLKQAVSAGVLSKRWTDLWMKIPRFMFDAYNMFGRELSNDEQRLRTLDFITLVNKVLKQLLVAAVSVSTFSGHYDMEDHSCEGSYYYINRWIERNVEILNLHFRKEGDVGSWLFPPQVATSHASRCSVTQLRLGACVVAPTFGGFKNLRLVSLSYVTVTDQSFENLLSSCLLLEDIFVSTAGDLKSVRIPDSLIRLKFLHLYCCDDLLKLEVNAKNLTSFTYIGPKVRFSFEKISKLKVLRLGYIDEAFSRLMSENLQLHTLILNRDIPSERLELDYEILPTLFNLKLLVLSVVALSDGLLGYINFLRAAPSLHKFELHLKGPDYYTYDLEKGFYIACRHELLREIELSGLLAKTGHVELALELIESAVALEKMTIVPFGKRLHLDNLQCDKPAADQFDAMRKCIDQISKKLPKTVKLEILE